ncbi:methyltransferase domain-containing protein, partial [Actinoplanes sp. TRM 88003]
QPQYLRDYLATAAASPDIVRVRATGLALWNLPADSGLQLLDAGAGNGEVARELATLLPGAHVTAVDFSADAIAEATARHDSSRVTYQVADIDNLPYDDGHFDGVRSERLLQHLREPSRAVAEMVRVLRPGGRLCLIDSDFESLLVDGSPPGFNDRVQAVSAASHATRPPEAASSGRTLRRRLVQAGLTDIHAEPVTIVFTDMASATQVLPLHRNNPMVARVPELSSLLDTIDEAVDDGTFLLAFTMWVAVGTRP